MGLANRRSIMTLFSDANDDIYSHQVRIVVAEKNVSLEIKLVDARQLTEELLELNSYGSLPIF